MLGGHLSSIAVAFDGLVVVGLVCVPGPHVEVGVDLLPNSLESLDHLDVIPKHFLADLVQTDALADVDHSPEQVLISPFELIGQVLGVRVDLARYQKESLL